MREIIARIVCLLTVIVIVVLSHTLAERHNPPTAAQPPSPRGSPREVPLDALRGRRVLDDQGCASCHAIAGAGNPRHPLDGVGERRTTAELRDWIMGTGSAAEQLSPAVVRRKQRYQELPETDITALVAYLAGLDAR